MIVIDNKEYRNIVEQVAKNKEDIAAHYNIDRVLADFGIKIIGQLTPEQFAPILANSTPPITGAEDYGASYAVGETDPYLFYIWTRADSEAGGSHENPYWLNIGQLAIDGIEGPAGATIASGTINANYQLVLTLTNGTVITVPGSLRGPAGSTGSTGPANSIVGFAVDPSTFRPTLTFADGSTATAALSIRGPAGPAGVGLVGP